MDTQLKIERLVELALIQRTELKELVEQLPQMRQFLTDEIEKNLEVIEPQLRSELEEFAKNKSGEFADSIEINLTEKVDELLRNLERTTAAKYSVLLAEKNKTKEIEQQAKDLIAAAALEIPSTVKSIVLDELSRFPRAGEIDQLRKEFAEPKGLNPRGKWQASERYQRLDLVAYNGDSYVSNTDDNKEKPSRTTSAWTLSAARGTGSGGGGVTSILDLVGASTDGQLLIGSNGDFAKATLTAGSGVTIANAPGSITISAAGGSGTVTSVSVTTANGVSGTVATSTTTPAISLTLGAITPTTVNAVTLSGSSTPALAVTGTSAISGTNTGDQTITLTGGVTGSGTGSFAATVVTNANLTGDVTSTGNATAIAAGVIVNADINASAAIVDTKLATISTASKVSNSATTAASANTASAIVARDASGNFTAGTITAALTGNASTATALATARTINGTSFDGSANITVTAAGSTLSDTVTIAKGGTGQVTANDALNALLPSQVGASGKVLQSDGTSTSFVAAGGSGTVTSVSVTTANGVSGTVATSTTTPAISLTLGAIVPTSVNSVVVSGASTPTLAVTGTTSVSGANTGDQTITLTGDVTGSGTGSFATTIAAGVIVNADINASAAIVDTKLDTISTALKVSNSATTAASANTASAIVARDASGNFTAGTITANLTGNASGSSGSTTGNAATATLASTATALATARAINGVNFDGTAAITVTAAGSTLSDTVTVAKGGTGAATLTANNVVLGNGTSAVQFVAPGTSGNVLSSNGTTWSSTAPSAGGITYTVTKTTTYTAVANDGVLTNTTGGAFTVTLPASPSNGDQIIVADAGGSWGTNNLTIGRNGNNIADLAEDLVCDISGASVQLVYNSSGTATWEVFAQIGGNGGTAVTLTGTQTLTNKTLTAPVLTAPVLGTVASGVISACTSTSMTLVTPLIGTPTSGNLSNCTADGTVSVGYRTIPLSGIKTATYNPVAGDVGKFIELGTSGSVTINASVFSTGDAFSIFNNTAAAITCTCSAITTVYKGGTNADISTFSLASRGVCTVLFITATLAVVTGNI